LLEQIVDDETMEQVVVSFGNFDDIAIAQFVD